MLSEGIERLLPHVGAMRMIGAVTQWNEEEIECIAQSHRDPAKPIPLTLHFERSGPIALDVPVEGGP